MPAHEAGRDEHPANAHCETCIIHYDYLTTNMMFYLKSTLLSSIPYQYLRYTHPYYEPKQAARASEIPRSRRGLLGCNDSSFWDEACNIHLRFCYAYTLLGEAKRFVLERASSR